MLLHRIPDAQLAILGQDHGSHCHNRLCHGVNLENCVGLDRLPSFQIGVAHGIKRSYFSMARNERDDAGGGAFVHELLHACGDLSETCGIKASSSSHHC